MRMDCVDPSFKNAGTGLMFWGSIRWNFKGQPYIYKGEKKKDKAAVKQLLNE